MRNCNEINAVGRNPGNRKRLKKRENLFPLCRRLSLVGPIDQPVLLDPPKSVDNFLLFFRHLIQRLVIYIVSNWPLYSTISEGYLFIMGVFYGVMCRFISATRCVSLFTSPCKALRPSSLFSLYFRGFPGLPGRRRRGGGIGGRPPRGPRNFNGPVFGAHMDKKGFSGV